MPPPPPPTPSQLRKPLPLDLTFLTINKKPCHVLYPSNYNSMRTQLQRYNEPPCLSSEILLPIHFPLNKSLSLKVKPHCSCEGTDSDSLHKNRKQETTRLKRRANRRENYGRVYKDKERKQRRKVRKKFKK